jgi:hypothetical protein
MWVEVLFNVAYLLVIWGLVAAMTRHRDRVAPEDRRVAGLARWAFLLLAVGDTGHVGFRVWAYAQGSLEATVRLFGRQVGLVGLGALATAVTVTLFYVLVLEMWRARFGKPYGWFGGLLLAAAGVRLVLMIPAANQWNNVVPPQPWSTVRNLPLILLGLGAAYLILRDARMAGDGTFTWIGAMIVLSYLCYMPVIFFVQRAPAVGMLMIPKTLAYVAIALIIYRSMYVAHPAGVVRAGASSRQEI